MKYFVTLPSGTEHIVDVIEDAHGALAVVVDGTPREIEAMGGPAARGNRGATSVRVGTAMVELWLEGDPPEVGVIANGQRFFAKIESERMRIQARNKGRAGGEGTVKTPMPGRVVRVLVNVGDAVLAGQPVVVVEAMKMENELAAGAAGTVRAVLVAAGATVESGAVLVEIAPSATPS